jgi:hypothetical protein
MKMTPRAKTASAGCLALVVGLLALSGCGTSPANPPVAPPPAATTTTPATPPVPTTDTTAVAAPANPPPVTATVAPQPVIPAIPEPEPTDPPPAATYYKSCAEAKAAGAAPLHRGDPGYRSGLDRDGDGVACEK